MPTNIQYAGELLGLWIGNRDAISHKSKKFVLLPEEKKGGVDVHPADVGEIP